MSPRCAVVVFLLAGVGTAAAALATEPFVGTFSGAAEIPPVASPASGSTQIEYDATARTLMVHVAFTGLSATATAAHIHCCAAPTANAGVAIALTGFPTGTTSGTYDHLFDLSNSTSYTSAFLAATGGTATSAELTLASALRAVGTYVNIHSSAFPAGEIRANPVPTLIFADGFNLGNTGEWSATVP